MPPGGIDRAQGPPDPEANRPRRLGLGQRTEAAAVALWAAAMSSGYAVACWGREGTGPPGRSSWSCAAGRRRRLRVRALTATIRLEPDIDRAAISGRSTRPKAGSNTPAAIGRATAL